MPQLHATCVALADTGVLLRGPSGSGKSDLALRLIESGARLVADDRTDLERRGDDVIASAPSAIAGLIEVRGIGIIEMNSLPEAPLRLVVDLVGPETVERLPAPTCCELLGVRLPLLALAPLEASAPIKVRLALRALAPGGLAR
jgi:serine kinase of HPr protein (carbohydrate metabolism regulator)